MTAKVIVERQGAVARVVLNAPEALNAIDPDMASEFSRVAAEVGEDPAVRCVIVTGAGPHFMAGGDIRCFAEWLELPAAERDARLGALISDVSDAVSRLRTMGKPVIGAVRGAVAGFGFSLMCACDLVVASDTTNCKLAYCQLAASPDGGGSHTLPRLVGVRKAMEIALLDERIDAASALALGLVTKVVADAALDEESMALAQRLAAQATGAFGRTKRLFNASLESDLATQLDAERQAFLAGAASQDFAEAVAAFVARRKPQFHGR
ncbi:MAG TPA: enoyl-CoA hydratase-related protein [Aromatoleum sp.]|uniref:enoyl-CoA hydratase/isomerase family protein n=1 Tax=Aromatoleum sp. TaxID=2307007 RepID=UPI002B49D460|nr:enoyl-CoA hydratase-related protein [Aromatoleum sp.]HJV26635.1 enoyl-CoA hydratase-related protein [Aromatoleum sp.]